MLEITFKIDIPKNFSEQERRTFLDLLNKQGKVKDPTIGKVNRCKLLCVCKVDNQIVSIGAIKQKTTSDFNSNKSDLEHLSNEFKIELGYCFTLPDYTGKGFSSTIVKMLLTEIGNHNLMASTELREDNSMNGILQRNGFKQYGNPWKSIIHKGTLGLYLKFVK